MNSLKGKPSMTTSHVGAQWRRLPLLVSALAELDSVVLTVGVSGPRGARPWEWCLSLPEPLLPPFLVRPEHRGLIGPGLRHSRVPLKAPQRQSHAIQARVNGRNIHRRLVALDLVEEEIDAGRDDQPLVGDLAAACEAIIAGRVEVAVVGGAVAEASIKRARRRGVDPVALPASGW